MKRTGQSKIAVVGWGRGMGHTGHMYLASAVITQAKMMHADPYFFVSKTVGKDDPLFPEEKIKIYQRVFPQQATIFTAEGNLNEALTQLAGLGYQGVVVVVGADQKNAFQYLEKPNKEGVPVYQSMGLQKLKVISRQETKDKYAHEEGPRATPMREILLQPDASEEQKYQVWRRDMPKALSDKEVMDIMRKAEARLLGSVKKQKIKEFIERVKPMLSSMSTEQKRKVYGLLESALKDKADYEAKTKALQDMEREPGHDKEAIRQRKLDLDKEAREQGLDESPEEALKYATKAHAGQTRSGGDPYITHPMRVADHIRQYKQSHNLDALISAAYLHDTIEDTDTTQEVLHDLFGGLVASLVKELTSDPEQIKKMGKAAYLSHKMAVMSSYGLVIKLADRLDNVKDITTAKTPEWRAKYAKETNQILDYIEKTRALSGTHKKLISLIRAKLAEIDNPPQQGVAEAGFTKTPSGDYINQHTGVRSSKLPVKKKRGEKTGAEWDAIEKAKKNKEQGVAEAEGISRRGILKGIAGAAAAGAAGKASAIAGAFPTPSHQAAMYKAAADSNAAQARADAAAKAKADAERLKQGTADIERLNKINFHGGKVTPINATWDGDSDFMDVDGTKYAMASRMPIRGDEPGNMKLVSTREGRQVYMWTRNSLKGVVGRYFYPAPAGTSQINEFAPSDDGDNGQEDMFFKYAKLWYNGNLQVQQRIEETLAQAGWEIGELESEEGGAFIVQSGDENGDTYMGWSQEELQGLNEFAPNGFDGFEDDNRVPMHFVVEKELYNRRSKWKKSRDADGVILFATKQQAIQAAEKFNKLDPNREFAYGGTQMVHVDDEDLDEGFDKEEFRRHMKDLEAREELRKTDPVAAKALDLRGQLPQATKKQPEDDSIGINDPRHPGYAYTQAGQHKLDEFAPGNGDDGLPYAEYQVYQCNPLDQFDWIGGPLYQTDSMGMAHKYAYEQYVKHRPKAFMIWQERSQGSRGNYGVKGESDQDDVNEDYIDEK